MENSSETTMAGHDIRNVRNICILAHVDHGKTTLADHLIAGTEGGHLHPKLAGKLRYMDYLDEEQRRAITMKSSSISLNFKDSDSKSYSINLIDSPGHMDFCSEVSTAARLSDGALVLVDAVEGVHIQTHAVLRQAWIEKLAPCLVLNKIDRLITELELTPMEAYNRLLRIVHEVNGIMSGYKSEKYLSDVDSILASQSGEFDDSIEFPEEDDEGDTFQPQKGNVAFVCALDGWGFTTEEFSKFYAAKYRMSPSAVQKGLWGAKFYDHKTGMIVGKKALSAGGSNHSNKARPMFVQFVLEPLWQVYHSVLKNNDKLLLEKVIKVFNLNVPARELQNKDPKLVLQSIMSRWLPLSNAVLSMVVRCLPGPVAAQSFRISRLLPKRSESECEAVREAEIVRRSVEVCDSSPESPCIAFVSKMFAVPSKLLPRNALNSDYDTGDGDLDLESDECFLAFARIFSGVLHSGQKIYALSSLYDPSNPDSTSKHLQEAEIQSLYLMMGQGLKPVASVKAGNLVAIRGLGQHILKSATLSSTRNCWPFSSMAFQVSPTLRVAIEPSDPADMGALMKGLKLLNRADPFVGVTVSSRGEQVLAAAGEVHLERCIKDLKDRFAKVSIEVSPPLVSFRESIEGDELVNTGSDYLEKVTPNGRCLVRVQVLKLPDAVTKLLDESAEMLAGIQGGKVDEDAVDSFRKRLLEATESDSSSSDNDRSEKHKVKWRKLLKRIWAFGPGQVGPNILFTPDPKTKANDPSLLIAASPSISQQLGLLSNRTDECCSSSESQTEAESLQNSIVSGFQLATSSGPLCDEPMWGLGFIVEATVSSSSTSQPSSESELESEPKHGIFPGQVMATVKDACRSAVLQNKPRLVEAMYFCELNARTEHLGPMYAVLNRRRARVLKEEMQEGSPLFTVHAYVPVAESFGFADELRRWTSGGASALLVLSHWEALEEDPFFVPRTEEEKEEFGDGASLLRNTARKLIDSVRTRKGLKVEVKHVQFGTKQRTLARKV